MSEMGDQGAKYTVSKVLTAFIAFHLHLVSRCLLRQHTVLAPTVLGGTPPYCIDSVHVLFAGKCRVLPVSDSCLAVSPLLIIRH